MDEVQWDKPYPQHLIWLQGTPKSHHRLLWKASQVRESSSRSGFCSHACTYLVRCFWWHRGWRFGLESILGHESRIMGGHTGQPHGCLLRQIGAAIAIVWTRWVRVRATGPGITTVNAVQTAVRDKRNKERKGERKRHKGGVGRDPYTVQLTFHMSLATGSINRKRKNVDKINLNIYIYICTYISVKNCKQLQYPLWPERKWHFTLNFTEMIIFSNDLQSKLGYGWRDLLHALPSFYKTCAKNVCWQLSPTAPRTKFSTASLAEGLKSSWFI